MSTTPIPLGHRWSTTCRPATSAISETTHAVRPRDRFRPGPARCLPRAVAGCCRHGRRCSRRLRRFAGPLRGPIPPASVSSRGPVRAERVGGGRPGGRHTPSGRHAIFDLTYMAIRHPRKMKMGHRRTTLRPSPRPSTPGRGRSGAPSARIFALSRHVTGRPGCGNSLDLGSSPARYRCPGSRR